MVTFSESFNKADGALGPDLTWTIVETDEWEVTNNQASPRGPDRGQTGYARAEHDTDTPDQYAQCVVAALVAEENNQGGPCARFDPSGNNSYMAMVDGNGTVTIRRTDGGSRTSISSSVPVDVTGLPKILRVEVEGSTIRGFWDGVEVVSTTDSTYTTATRGGLYGHEDTGQSLSVVVDDFEFGDLAEPAIDLTVADLIHSPTIDSVTVTQVHELAVASVTHATVLDSIDVTQTHALVVADVTHAPTLDSVTITQVYVLVVADVTHAPTLDTVGLIGVVSALIVGTITGPNRVTTTVTGPHAARIIDGVTVARVVTGPMRATDTVTGPHLSRTLTGTDRSDTPTPTGPDAIDRTPTGPALSHILTGPNL